MRFKLDDSLLRLIIHSSKSVLPISSLISSFPEFHLIFNHCSNSILNDEMTTSPVMILYYDEVSPPVRGVLLAIAALGVKDRIKFEYIDLFKGGHLSSDYLKVVQPHATTSK